ncbi:hypothetical protein BP422_06295 [Brevibacillus formosus]|uniref:Uncharacterized protein n=1 Tax=Brevibacillus formosus TaxID=54913 RepID=A0A220ME12_9BACL|nr:hypothetical protein [Brevibacillus formosus]ASJ53192.1 hypothetical protein BP422_06295 [Brevibacillus formosus]
MGLIVQEEWLLGIDTQGFQMIKRPKSFEEAKENNLVSLGDLFRRVPELQPVVHEYLNQPPLSFHVGHADKNDIINFEERKARGFSFH